MPLGQNYTGTRRGEARGGQPAKRPGRIGNVGAAKAEARQVKHAAQRAERHPAPAPRPGSLQGRVRQNRPGLVQRPTRPARPPLTLPGEPSPVVDELPPAPPVFPDNDSDGTVTGGDYYGGTDYGYNPGDGTGNYGPLPDFGGYETAPGSYQDPEVAPPEESGVINDSGAFPLEEYGQTGLYPDADSDFGIYAEADYQNTYQPDTTYQGAAYEVTPSFYEAYGEFGQPAQDLDDFGWMSGFAGYDDFDQWGSNWYEHVPVGNQYPYSVIGAGCDVTGAGAMLPGISMAPGVAMPEGYSLPDIGGPVRTVTNQRGDVIAVEGGDLEQERRNLMTMADNAADMMGLAAGWGFWVRNPDKDSTDFDALTGELVDGIKSANRNGNAADFTSRIKGGIADLETAIKGVKVNDLNAYAAGFYAMEAASWYLLSKSFAAASHGIALPVAVIQAALDRAENMAAGMRQAIASSAELRRLVARSDWQAGWEAITPIIENFRNTVAKLAADVGKAVGLGAGLGVVLLGGLALLALGKK